MKTIKILSALTFVMWFGVFTSVTAQSNRSSIEVPATFIVTVDNNVNLDGGMYYVKVLNDLNKPVAPPQVLQEGISTYIFVEYGSIAGNRRTATVVKDPQYKSNTIVFDPVNLKGPFMPGKKYFFPLLAPDKHLKVQSPLFNL
jgi:hypothetical protein